MYVVLRNQISAQANCQPGLNPAVPSINSIGTRIMLKRLQVSSGPTYGGYHLTNVVKFLRDVDKKLYTSSYKLIHCYLLT